MNDFSRNEFETLWERFNLEAMESKRSNEVVVRLAKFYGTLAESDRRVVNNVLSDWITHGDSRRRFDALALVYEYNIHSCLPAVRERLRQLEGASGPSVPYDRMKLRRIINRVKERT